MFKNYFKIAWRNLLRNKSFSFTNILGLGIGMTCSILIFLWVKDELSFNKSQENYDDIYQVMANRDFDNQVFTDESMVLPLAKEIERNVSQAKYAVVTTHEENKNLANGEVKLKKKGYTVSEHFFSVFSATFIKGNATTAIADPSSIVLSASSARALFGNADPIGKLVKIDNDRNAKVSAVVADLLANTTLRFDYIMPFNYSSPDVQQAMGEWTSSSWLVFVQAKPAADMVLLQKRINEIKAQHDPKDKKISTYFTFPMSKWRLYSDFKDGKNTGGMIDYVRMFTIIAIIILLIACINFMNLSTARSEKRAREVGIRKTLGSGKKELILQFFFESMILAFISFLFSIIAVYLLLPSFNHMVDKQLSLNLSTPLFWLTAVAIIFLTGIIAGSYPALYLSSFKPVRVLKGSFLSGRGAVLPRQVLIVAQFVISILLISATVIVYRQIDLIKNRDVGYDPNNLVYVPGTPDTQKNFDVIKQELLKTGAVAYVTRTLSPITEIWWNSPGPDYSGKPANMNVIFKALLADKDFSKTFGVKMLQGNDFTGTPADSSSMLLNKAAVEAMSIKDVVGMKMHYGRDYTVIGVTDNVVMESPFKPVEPMMIYYAPQDAAVISMRLANAVSPQTAIASLEKIFRKYNPAYPFEYQFVDQEFGKKFLSEILISRLSNIFAALAIFICCMGLAGLAAYTIEKRIREISIRKVLGATVRQVLMLISSEFLKLVLLAFVIAVPLSWWLMHNWLQQYEFRVNISGWMFASVGLLVMLLALLVIGANTISAALRNPVKSLRAE